MKGIKFKRLAAMAIALAMLAGLAVGCGGSGGGGQTTAGAAATTAAAAETTKAAPTTTTAAATTEAKKDWKYVKGGPISEEPVTITLLTHSGWAPTLAVPNNDLPVYKALMERTGITVDWQIVENAAYAETVLVRLMSSDLPDIAVIVGPLPPFSKMVEDGAFISYEDLNFEENAPYAVDLFKDPEYAGMHKGFKSIFPDGKIYAFGGTVLTKYLVSNSLINTVWQEKLGIPDPETLDDFFNMLIAFRDQDPNGNGEKDEVIIGFPDGLNMNILDVFDLHGLCMGQDWEADENGNLTYMPTTERFRDYLEFRKKLFDEDLVDKEKRNLDQLFELIAQDRLGVVQFWATFSGILTGHSPHYDREKDNYVFREMQVLKGVYSGERKKSSRLIAPGVGEGMLILKEAKYPEVCLRFADFTWASPEYETMLNFGVEGISYDVVEGKIVTKVPEGFDTLSAWLAANGGAQPPYCYRQSEPGWRQQYPVWATERADEVRPYYIDFLQPFFFTATETDELIKAGRDDINTHRTEMEANFISGRRSLGEWDKYVEEINSMGLDQIKKIVQAKYDALYK